MQGRSFKLVTFDADNTLWDFSTMMVHGTQAVVDAIRADRFWILAPSTSSDARIRARAGSMLERSNPTYLKDVTG